MYDQEHNYYVKAIKHMDGYDKYLFMHYNEATGAIAFVDDKNNATAFDNLDELCRFVEANDTYLLSKIGVVCGKLERVM
jgi:hypothetical protein